MRLCQGISKFETVGSKHGRPAMHVAFVPAREGVLSRYKADEQRRREERQQAREGGGGGGGGGARAAFTARVCSAGWPFHHRVPAKDLLTLARAEQDGETSTEKVSSRMDYCNCILHAEGSDCAPTAL